MKNASNQGLQAALDYARDYYKDQAIVQEFQRLAKYCPEVVIGYLTLRQGAFKTPPEGGALPLKYKELLAVAIECARVMPSDYHARKAIEAGATPQEVAEMVSLCIQLGGMVTYMHSGRYALKAAEDRLAELHDEKTPKEDG